MPEVLIWYFIISVIGLIAWPGLYVLLPSLPDRGYSISKAAGLLVCGYVFWVLGILGVLVNTVGAIVFSIVLVAAVSAGLYFSNPDRQETLVDWLKAHVSYVLVYEALFLGAFAFWAVVRAYNPELNSTEKPMELAFLNGILKSPRFPAYDPWLSGYSISYYYFGYVIIAMVAKLAGNIGSIAFNLAIALLFALTLAGSYGLASNLLAARRKIISDTVSGLLAPIMIGVMGNWEGFLELVRAWNLSFVPIAFWQWLDIEDLTVPLNKILWPPDMWRFWWWWRASRVIQDRDLTGMSIGLQPIDEFPFFSFLLGDMHPHVLALPFILLALALAFNLLNQEREIDKQQIGLYALCFGGLAFLNTWDFPIYTFVLAACMLVPLLAGPLRDKFNWNLLWAKVYPLFAITGIGILLYLPWYISFRSQLGGILPNVLFPTRLNQFAVMMGPFLIIMIWYLIRSGAAFWKTANWKVGLSVGAGILAVLAVIATALGLLALKLDPSAQVFLLSSTGLSTDGTAAELAARTNQALGMVLVDRLQQPLTAILLIGIIGVAISLLVPAIAESESDTAESDSTHRFVLILIVTGALLTLAPEFVYLRDFFGQRLNTIFKFYYAAWILFGVASAVGAVRILTESNGFHRIMFGVILVGVVGMGMAYPAFAIPEKTSAFTSPQGQSPTLDGIDFIKRQYPDDYAGILWLQQNSTPGEIVLEAVGGSYQYNGRVSAATGLPTVLGWPGHEHQWRGNLFLEVASGREEAVREIYATPSMRRALELLKQYQVRYIFVGSLERNPDYSTAEGIAKFDRFLTPVFRQGNVAVYRVDKLLEESLP
jgi:YYY domain-containing protein